MKVRTLVVGFDGSADARRALDAACDLVAPDGVVHVVTAFHAPSEAQYLEMLASLPEEFRGSYDPVEADRVQLADAERLLQSRGIDHKGHFVEDHPAAAIIDVADDLDADLIVVGSRGLGRATRFLRGSVSSRVASHAKTSFMVVQ